MKSDVHTTLFHAAWSDLVKKPLIIEVRRARPDEPVNTVSEPFIIPPAKA